MICNHSQFLLNSNHVMFFQGKNDACISLRYIARLNNILLLKISLIIFYLLYYDVMLGLQKVTHYI